MKGLRARLGCFLVEAKWQIVFTQKRHTAFLEPNIRANAGMITLIHAEDSLEFQLLRQSTLPGRDGSDVEELLAVVENKQQFSNK